MKARRFWSWLLSLFSPARSKQLHAAPVIETDWDTVFLKAVADREEYERVRKRELEEEQRRKKLKRAEHLKSFIKPAHFERVMNFLASELSRLDGCSSGRIEIDRHTPSMDGLTDDELDVFLPMLEELFLTRGIKTDLINASSYRSILVDLASLRAYRQRCEDKLKQKQPTIITGAYR